MFGNLYTAKPNDLKKHLKYIRQDIVNVLLITRYGFDFDDAFRYYNLAPSFELFNKIESLKKEFGGDWFSHYSKLFNNELETDEKQFGINEVKSALESGMDIVLVCYCSDYNKCHRKLVADYFEKIGIDSKELSEKV